MQDLKICKVCRSDESDGPLFYPCACKGSIRYVHDKCLQTWISHSKSTSCEVCKCTYKFAPRMSLLFSVSLISNSLLNFSLQIWHPECALFHRPVSGHFQDDDQDREEDLSPPPHCAVLGRFRSVHDVARVLLLPGQVSAAHWDAVHH